MSLALNIIVKDVTQMKNAVKKITAAAMAFTLLGAGTTFTKTISPKSNNTLVASAVNSDDAKNSISFLTVIGGLLDKFWPVKAWTETGKAANNLVDQINARNDWHREMQEMLDGLQ